MGRQVTVNAGYSNVVLPNGGLYDEADVAQLTDEQWARVNPEMVGEESVLTDDGFIDFGEGGAHLTETEHDALDHDGLPGVPSAAALAAHEADGTAVHGIADTADLETQAGAQAKADAARSAAEATAAADTDADVATHEAAAPAHPATGVSFDPTGLTNLTETQVQAALAELDGLVGGGGGARTADLFVAASDAPQAVKDGADYVCDGTNDEVEINAALAALPATGGTVQLSSGRFDTLNAITIGIANTTLRGLGAATVIQAQPGFAGTLRVVNVTAADVTVRDLVVDGNRANVAGSNIFGVYAQFATRARLLNLTLRNNGGTAIHAGSTDTANFVHVLGCRFEGGGREGVILGGNYGIVADCDFAGGTPAGNHIAVNVMGLYCVVANNVVQNYDIGIWVFGGHHAAVTGNVVRSDPLVLFGTLINVGSATDVLIASNRGVGRKNTSGTVGIAVGSGADRCTVVGNHLSQGRDGINVSAVDALIEGNRIHDTFSEAIDVAATGDRAQVRGNAISTATTGLLVKAGAEDVTASDNTFTGTTANAVNVHPAALRTRVLHNDLTDQTFTDAGTDTVAYGNRLSTTDTGDRALDITAHETNEHSTAVNVVAATGATEVISFGTKVHDLTMDEDCTFSFADIPASGQVAAVTVIVRGAFAPTFSVEWPDGTPPTYGSPAIYTFMVVDGVTVLGMMAGASFA